MTRVSNVVVVVVEVVVVVVVGVVVWCFALAACPQYSRCERDRARDFNLRKDLDYERLKYANLSTSLTYELINMCMHVCVCVCAHFTYV